MKRKNHVNKVLQVNRTIIKIVVICSLILVATSSKVNITAIEAQKKEVLASETEEASRVVWVDSTELDESGDAKQVPVPKGFTASQIEGETTVSGGFVIYEGDVDWSKIIVEEQKIEEEIITVEENDIINKTTTIDDTTSTKEIEVVSETESKPTAVTYVENTEEVTIEETAEVTQTEINIFNLQKTTNQYVWVPIEDVSEIYGVDANGKMLGKIYNFSSSGRTANNWSETNGIMSIKTAINSSYREPEVASTMTQWDIDSLLPEYISGQSRYELLTKEIEQNFYEMIKSIKKYGGFYIGRYETGSLNGTAVVRKMDTNIAKQTWYTMYNKCKQLGASNDNLATSMIYGSLWDATLEWFIGSSTSTLTNTLVGSDSTTWGNYYDATFEYITPTAVTPVETTNKAEKTEQIIPTGSAEYTKVNNIYDLAGNIEEWTIESYHIGNRAKRGGYFTYAGCGKPAGNRNSYYPNANAFTVGCRVSLWIK